MISVTIPSDTDIDRIIADAARDGYLVVMAARDGGAEPRVRPAIVIEGAQAPYTVRIYADSTSGPGTWVPIAEAARRLGLTRQAVHARVLRGTMRWRRNDVTGRVEVRL